MPEVKAPAPPAFVTVTKVLPVAVPPFRINRSEGDPSTSKNVLNPIVPPAPTYESTVNVLNTPPLGAENAIVLPSFLKVVRFELPVRFHNVSFCSVTCEVEPACVIIAPVIVELSASTVAKPGTVPTISVLVRTLRAIFDPVVSVESFKVIFAVPPKTPMASPIAEMTTLFVVIVLTGAVVEVEVARIPCAPALLVVIEPLVIVSVLPLSASIPELRSPFVTMVVSSNVNVEPLVARAPTAPAPASPTKLPVP